jgi:hypothetical protein
VENVGLRRAGLLPGILRPEDQIVKPLREARKSVLTFILVLTVILGGAAVHPCDHRLALNVASAPEGGVSAPKRLVRRPVRREYNMIERPQPRMP